MANFRVSVKRYDHSDITWREFDISADSSEQAIASVELNPGEYVDKCVSQPATRFDYSQVELYRSLGLIH